MKHKNPSIVTLVKACVKLFYSVIVWVVALPIQSKGNPTLVRVELRLDFPWNVFLSEKVVEDKYDFYFVFSIVCINRLYNNANTHEDST